MANKLSGPAMPEVKAAESEAPIKSVALGADGLYPVEHWHLTRKTLPSVQAGIMAHAGWYPGKLVTKTEYDEAEAAFKGGAKHA